MTDKTNPISEPGQVASAAVDELADVLDLGERDTDLLDLFAALLVARLAAPHARLDDVFQESYGTGEPITRWWHGE